jgi:toxin ParE1/3/4
VRRIIYAARARRDLNHIWSYIAKDDVGTADRIIAEVRAVVRNLAQVPGIGHSRHDLLGKHPYLVRNIYRYLIIYRFNDDELLVVRIVHGARDVGTVFRRGLK